MKSLCTDDAQRIHIDKLVNLIQAKTLNGTQAWSAFAAPASSKKFTNKDPKTKVETVTTVNFSSDECSTYKLIRQLVQRNLFEKFGRTCAYCRRPVGHYGISWHIEHVLPKSKYSSHTFDLANLTVGCVDCNFWKGRRVDLHVKNKKLPIINPLDPNFDYSSHLQYLQLSTEDISFTKYLIKKSPGQETYEKLNFAEIERAYVIDGVDPMTASLHERIMQVVSGGLVDPDAQDLITLLSELKSAIYRVNK
jgi:uncharacterized protein (TIGR02646 family)